MNEVFCLVLARILSVSNCTNVKSTHCGPKLLLFECRINTERVFIYYFFELSNVNKSSMFYTYDNINVLLIAVGFFSFSFLLLLFC